MTKGTEVVGGDGTLIEIYFTGNVHFGPIFLQILPICNLSVIFPVLYMIKSVGEIAAGGGRFLF